MFLSLLRSLPLPDTLHVQRNIVSHQDRYYTIPSNSQLFSYWHPLEFVQDYQTDAKSR